MMKKSFFKRAVATAAAVPLALTQCLTSSFAETSADTSSQAGVSKAEEGKTYTLEQLLRIEPNKKYSEWNVDLDSAMMAVSLAGNTSGTIDTSKLVSLVSGSARSYKELAENVLGQVKNVQYTIDAERNIIITADVDNISEALSRDFDKSLGSAVKKLAENVGVDGILDIDYTTVDASGKIEIVIGTSNLGASTTIPVSLTFTPNGGSALDVNGSIQYAKDVIEQYRKISYDKIDEYAAYIDAEAAKAEIDKSFDLYLNNIDKAESYYNRIATKTLPKDKAYANVTELIADLNANLKKNNINRKIPASGAAIAANATVSAAYDVVMDVLNNAAGSVATFDIQVSELGAFADGLRNINVSAKNGTYTLTGEFDDAEADEVAAYYNTTPTEGDYVNSYKIFTGAATIGSDNAVDVQIERVVVTKPKTTTTTSTSTTTTTTTTTTSTTTTSTSTTTTTTTTTTGAAKVTGKSYAEVESDYGFYYSYEESFNAKQLGEAKLYTPYDNIAVDENNDPVLDEDGNQIVLSSGVDKEDITGNVEFGANTPENTFDVDNMTFRYDIPLSYNGEALVDVNGEPITAEVYIGKRGDVTLDNTINGSDATYMLTAYALINSSSGGQIDPNTVLFTREEITTDPAGILDQFAAFLGDVDCNITDNWKATKNQRSIMATDATYLLNAYTMLNSNYSGTEKELWLSITGK